MVVASLRISTRGAIAATAAEGVGQWGMGKRQEQGVDSTAAACLQWGLPTISAAATTPTKTAAKAQAVLLIITQTRLPWEKEA